MGCDLCGKEGSLVVAKIEGTELNVCSSCGQHGKVIRTVQGIVVAPKQVVRESGPEVMQLVVEDYGKRIRGKRDSLGLTQEKFSQQLNEKESVIQHLETGKGGLSLELARKLERKLGITLVEEYTDTKEGGTVSKSQGLTIGDMIKVKK
tara:strand:- start:617 stop:1063 length:447 start_codon:yes stop_codon:yes gene_type:complete